MPSSARHTSAQPKRIEWITLSLILACLALWATSIWILPSVSWALAIIALVLSLVLHASLTHEVCHGHPLPSRHASDALMHINPGLAVPYLRFRDTHLAHHQDSLLTDPYDDPESNFLDPAVWARMPAWVKALRRINNTLAGRIVLGPLIGQISFMAGDLREIRKGDRTVLWGWLLHIPGAALILWLLAQSPMPLWLYLFACYIALGILKIRTFLEHQAHEKARGRTVIIEDRGLLAFLFLNNNLHVVHHMHPKLPWYQLPALYRARKTRYQSCNDGYVYRSYGEIFRRYFLSAKDPVPHPLWPDPKR
jgi:fatty acid desaturase